jgi:nitroreductase
MDLREALYTTRAMRRMKPDPIPREVQMRILDAAVRAPTGGNFQGWRFLLVDAPEVKQQFAPIYRAAISQLWRTIYAERIAQANAKPEAPDSRSLFRMIRSADDLADHFAQVPLLLFGFSGMGDTTGGSIFPAVWSAMLAARAEGVGSVLTQVFGMHGDVDVDRILGVPEGQGWHNACCVPMGYPTGRWGTAPRRPAHEVAYHNRWGRALDFEVPRALWP